MTSALLIVTGLSPTPSRFDSNEEHVHESWNMGENTHQQHHILISIEDFVQVGYDAKRAGPDGNTFALYRVADVKKSTS